MYLEFITNQEIAHHADAKFAHRSYSLGLRHLDEICRRASHLAEEFRNGGFVHAISVVFD